MSKELLRIVTDFREGILGDWISNRKCFIVCLPLAGFLPLCGYEAELTEGQINGYQHFWLTLPDGQIIDPTADQFTRPDGTDMPVVYIGEKPDWYLAQPIPRPKAKHRAEQGIKGR